LKNSNTAGDDQRTTDLIAQVFLAYAAEDERRAPEDGAATVESLRRLLTQARMTYWEYPNPWPPAADPETVISRAAEACDNYVLLLSPRALSDALCLQGLLFAFSMNKRVVPVLVEAVPTEHLPEPLQTLDAIDLRAALPPLEQTSAGPQLIETLQHQADYHRAHTQLLVKALQWERQLRDPSLLLQGKELARYQRWLAVASGRSRHQPIQLQTLYVAESTHRWGSQGDVVTQGLDWLKRWLE